MNNRHLGRRIRRLLEFGGYVQLLLALGGSIGLNGVVVVAVGSALRPLTGWEIALLVALFFAATPLTFPISAVLLNIGLSQVEKSRRREILDSPAETARKTIDEAIAHGRRMVEGLPAAFGSTNEADYHYHRWDHFFRDTDSAVLRVAGEWAACCFAVNDLPEPWRSRQAPETADEIRDRYTRDIHRLERIRDDLPVDRRKWNRVSVSLDIESGRTLLAFLKSGEGDGFGAAELERWRSAAYGSMHRDGVDGAHLFAPETLTNVSTLPARISYLESRLQILEELWRKL